MGFRTLYTFLDRFFVVRVRMRTVSQPWIVLQLVLVFLLIIAERPVRVDQVISLWRSYVVNELTFFVLQREEKSRWTERNFLAFMFFLVIKLGLIITGRRNRKTRMEPSIEILVWRRTSFNLFLTLALSLIVNQRSRTNTIALASFPVEILTLATVVLAFSSLLIVFRVIWASLSWIS